MLSPHRATNDPRGELRWCLSKLRGVIGGARVIARDDPVRLDLSDCHVDVLEIERAAKAGIDTLALERCRALAMLFGGDFLQGLDIDCSPVFRGWLVGQRRRFRGYHAALLEHWRTERYGRDNPYLTAEACDLLARAGAAFVGIDSLNIDDVADLARPAHTILLGAGIPVCEHMTHLAQLPLSGGHLHAVPIAWRGGATFPVRAYVQF